MIAQLVGTDPWGITCARFSTDYLSPSLNLFLLFGAVRPQLFPRYFSPCERLATRCLIIAVKIIIPMDQSSPCRRHRRRRRRWAAASSSREESSEENPVIIIPASNASLGHDGGGASERQRGRESFLAKLLTALRISARETLATQRVAGPSMPVRSREHSLACRGTEDTAN